MLDIGSATSATDPTPDTLLAPEVVADAFRVRAAPRIDAGHVSGELPRFGLAARIPGEIGAEAAEGQIRLRNRRGADNRGAPREVAAERHRSTRAEERRGHLHEQRLQEVVRDDGHGTFRELPATSAQHLAAERTDEHGVERFREEA